MPKLKTKSSAKKRFSFTATGHVICQPAFKRHNLRKRSQKMKKQNRGTIVLPDCEVHNILKYMPYSGR